MAAARHVTTPRVGLPTSHPAVACRATLRPCQTLSVAPAAARHVVLCGGAACRSPVRRAALRWVTYATRHRMRLVAPPLVSYVPPRYSLPPRSLFPLSRPALLSAYTIPSRGAARRAAPAGKAACDHLQRTFRQGWHWQGGWVAAPLAGSLAGTSLCCAQPALMVPALHAVSYIGGGGGGGGGRFRRHDGRRGVLKQRAQARAGMATCCLASHGRFAFGQAAGKPVG